MSGRRKRGRRSRRSANKNGLNYFPAFVMGMIFVLVIVGLFFGVKAISGASSKLAKEAIENTTDFVAATDNKLFGDVTNEKYAKSNKAYIINYPKFNNKNGDAKIDEIIQTIKNDFNESATVKKNTYVLFVDYSTKYINNKTAGLITFTAKSGIYSQELKDKKYEITVNPETGDQLKLKDVLYGDYLNKIDLLMKRDLGYGADEITEDFTNFTLTSSSLKLKLEKDEYEIPARLLSDISDISDIDPNKPMIALTFDDGPNTETTTKLIDCFNKYNGKGTFFVLGDRINNYSDTLLECYLNGNEIGSHTLNHKVLSKLSQSELEYQINKTDELIKNVIGTKPKVVRPPYGDRNENVIKTINRPVIIWNVDTLDWKTRSAQSTTNSILSNASDGDIILMHDIYDSSVQGAIDAIPTLIERGYQLVTVSELIKYKGEKATAKVYYDLNK